MRADNESPLLVPEAQSAFHPHAQREVAGGVEVERTITSGCVVVAVVVPIERVKTDRRLAGASCKAEERISTLSGVVAGIVERTRSSRNPN
jgi:hypothetical protein